QGSTSPTSHLPASSDALDPTSASLILSLRQTALAVVTASSPTRTFRLERTITTSTSRGSRSKMVAATSWYCHRAGEDSSASTTPWPVNIFGPSGASNSNDTDTAHGPLDIKLSVNSFNFTQGTKTISQPSWNIPYRANVVFWIK